MIRRRRRTRHAATALSLAFAAALGFAEARAEEPAHAVQPPRRFESLGLAQGLSNSNVTALALDRDGFVWIGTSEGLNRWDGLEMRVFRHRPGDAGSLASNRVSALLVDRDGTLWVGMRGGGLARYDPDLERFATFRHRADAPESLAHDDVAALAEDREGRLWAALWRGGVDRIERGEGGELTLGAIHHRHDPADPASLADDRTRALAIDGGGRLWVGTLGGLHRLESEAPARFARFVHDPGRAGSLADDEVWAVLADRDGAIWAGSWGGGLDRLADADAVPGSERFTNFAADEGDPRALPAPLVRHLHEDRSGSIWVSTMGSGIAELDRDALAAIRAGGAARFRVHRHDPGWRFAISGDAGTSVLEDAAGDLWFGTEAGVSRIDRRHERNLYLRHDPGEPASLPAGGVGGGFEDSRGAIWVPVGAGLTRIRFADEARRLPAVDRLDPDGTGPLRLPFRDVYDVVEDGSGDLWFASAADGLWRLPAAESGRAAPRFESVAGRNGDLRGLSSNAALSLLVDRRGRLWVGTYRGLHLLLRDEAGRPSGFRVFRHVPDDPATLSSDRISALVEGADGAIWVGCYFGLNRVDPDSGAVERFVPDPSADGALSYEHVLALHVDASGALWVGTYGGGLDRFDAAVKRFRVYGAREGLPSESIHGIAGDGGGGLWLATARGLAHLDPASGTIRVRGVDDGLLDEELSAVDRLRDGRILVASSEGLALLDPAPPLLPAPPPPVRVTGLRRRNEPVAIGADALLPRAPSRLDRIVFGPGDRQFAFEFAALAFRQPARHRYRYRLAGHDAGWLESSGADRRAVYSNVPPGRYRFQVAAADESGQWNESGAALDVVVRPPWWKTAWARFGGVALLVGVVVAGHRTRVARLTRAQRRLEETVNERTAELASANLRLEHASRTDLLTGLPNRRHFLERGAAEEVAQRRSRRPYSILLGDVDHFKAINDGYGHEGGDQVLAAVGTTLRDTVRERDTPARWGGEEFIVLLPETDAAGAALAAEKIRAGVESLRVYAGEREIRMTMTIGVAEAAPEEALDVVVARADAALYSGKRAGRNRVELASRATA